MARKVIITCAITGSIHTPSMSPALPVTAEDAVRAVEICEAIRTSHRQNNTRIEL